MRKGDGAAQTEPVSAFTEDQLIEVLRRLLEDDEPGVILGPGDDAALVEVGGRLAVLTTDLLLEEVHFTRETISPRDLGYKAVAVNVSDVAAVGGSPRYALVTLGLPRDVPMAWVVELYGGLREAGREYALSVVGGDTSRSERILVSVSVMGEVLPGAEVRRSGARPGDRVVVTGVLGASAGGLLLGQHRRTPEVASALSSQWARDLLAAHARPAARVGEGPTLAAAGATAMIDVSDGLALDLSRLCRESGVGAAVELAAVPVAPGLEHLRAILSIDPLELALGGGEDYELLGTLAPEDVAPAVELLADRFGTPLTDIGEIREGSGLVAVDEDGSERPLEPKGWDHFAR